MLINLTISINNCNSNINCDDNTYYGIIDYTWYDFIYEFKDLRFSNNMDIIIMCKI